LNYLCTGNSTLNYTLINLLSTKRLNHNLINNFVQKFSSSSRYVQKKKKKTQKQKKKKNKKKKKKNSQNS